MSRRVKIPSWKVDLEELENTQALEQPQDGSSTNTECIQSTEVDCQESKRLTSNPVKLSGSPYMNLAFVPEIEVTTPENTPLPQPDDNADTSNKASSIQEGCLQPPLYHPPEDEGNSESKRSDFV